MRFPARLGRRGLLAAAALVIGSTLAAGPASASPTHPTSPRHPAPVPAGAVFIQLNSPTGNRIAAYDRAVDGRLSAAGSYATAGLGGSAVGAPLDALASQSSLVLSRGVLIAVNAGSDTVTSFSVRGSHLARTSVVGSSGSFPVSVAVRGDLVYVLDAGGAGTVSGFRLHGSRLVPLPGSTRTLGLANATPPVFISAPSQVGFSGDGRVLIVATKNNNKLLTFPVGRDGRLPAAPVVTPSSGPVPFSFVTDRGAGLYVTQAGDGTTASYAVRPDGRLVPTGTSAPTGGSALCWNLRVGRTIYGANAGSASLSAWRIERGHVAVLTAPVAADTDAGPVDLAASRDRRFVYGLNAVAGTIGVYAVHRHGALRTLQTVGGVPPFADGDGPEGIAAY